MVIDDLQEVLMADYLRIPHMVLKMQRKLANPSAYGCLQFIWYKTGGWNKGRDTISYSQFKNDKVHGLGISTRTIKRGLEVLIEMKLIHATPSFNSMNEYSLNLDVIRALASDEEGVTICHTHTDGRGDNLSIGGDNLSAKGCQNVTHNRYYTQDTNTTDTNTTDTADVSVTETDVTATEKPKATAKKKPAKKTEPKFNPLEITLPDYVDTEMWAGYHQMRADIKKTATEYACKLLLTDFDEWHKRGLDVNASLKKSVIAKWTGVFEPKERLQQANSQFTNYRNTADPLAVNEAWGYDAPMTDAERREYLNLPAIDNNDDYGQPAFDFTSQGVTQL